MNSTNSAGVTGDGTAPTSNSVLRTSRDFRLMTRLGLPNTLIVSCETA
jgi:hypothetical protein